MTERVPPLLQSATRGDLYKRSTSAHLINNKQGGQQHKQAGGLLQSCLTSVSCRVLCGLPPKRTRGGCHDDVQNMTRDARPGPPRGWCQPGATTCDKIKSWRRGFFSTTTGALLPVAEAEAPISNLDRSRIYCKKTCLVRSR